MRPSARTGRAANSWRFRRLHASAVNDEFDPIGNRRGGEVWLF